MAKLTAYKKGNDIYLLHKSESARDINSELKKFRLYKLTELGFDNDRHSYNLQMILEAEANHIDMANMQPINNAPVVELPHYDDIYGGNRIGAWLLKDLLVLYSGKSVHGASAEATFPNLLGPLFNAKNPSATQPNVTQPSSATPAQYQYKFFLAKGGKLIRKDNSASPPAYQEVGQWIYNVAENKLNFRYYDNSIPVDGSQVKEFQESFISKAIFYDNSPQPNSKKLIDFHEFEDGFVIYEKQLYANQLERLKAEFAFISNFNVFKIFIERNSQRISNDVLKIYENTKQVFNNEILNLESALKSNNPEDFQRAADLVRAKLVGLYGVIKHVGLLRHVGLRNTDSAVFESLIADSSTSVSSAADSSNMGIENTSAIAANSSLGTSASASLTVPSAETVRYPGITAIFNKMKNLVSSNSRITPSAAAGPARPEKGGTIYTQQILRRVENSQDRFFIFCNDGSLILATPKKNVAGAGGLERSFKLEQIGSWVINERNQLFCFFHKEGSLALDDQEKLSNKILTEEPNFLRLNQRTNYVNKDYIYFEPENSPITQHLQEIQATRLEEIEQQIDAYKARLEAYEANDNDKAEARRGLHDLSKNCALLKQQYKAGVNSTGALNLFKQIQIGFAHCTEIMTSLFLSNDVHASNSEVTEATTTTTTTNNNLSVNGSDSSNGSEERARTLANDSDPILAAAPPVTTATGSSAVILDTTSATSSITAPATPLQPASSEAGVNKPILGFQFRNAGRSRSYPTINVSAGGSASTNTASRGTVLSSESPRSATDSDAGVPEEELDSGGDVLSETNNSENATHAPVAPPGDGENNNDSQLTPMSADGNPVMLPVGTTSTGTDQEQPNNRGRKSFSLFALLRRLPVVRSVLRYASRNTAAPTAEQPQTVSPAPVANLPTDTAPIPSESDESLTIAALFLHEGDDFRSFHPTTTAHEPTTAELLPVPAVEELATDPVSPIPGGAIGATTSRSPSSVGASVTVESELAAANNDTATALRRVYEAMGSVAQSGRRDLFDELADSGGENRRSPNPLTSLSVVGSVDGGDAAANGHNSETSSTNVSETNEFEDEDNNTELGSQKVAYIFHLKNGVVIAADGPKNVNFTDASVNGWQNLTSIRALPMRWRRDSILESSQKIKIIYADEESEINSEFNRFKNDNDWRKYLQDQESVCRTISDVSSLSTYTLEKSEDVGRFEDLQRAFDILAELPKLQTLPSFVSDLTTTFNADAAAAAAGDTVPLTEPSLENNANRGLVVDSFADENSGAPTTNAGAAAATPPPPQFIYLDDGSVIEQINGTNKKIGTWEYEEDTSNKQGRVVFTPSDLEVDIRRLLENSSEVCRIDKVGDSHPDEIKDEFTIAALFHNAQVNRDRLLSQKMNEKVQAADALFRSIFVLNTSIGDLSDKLSAAKSLHKIIHLIARDAGNCDSIEKRLYANQAIEYADELSLKVAEIESAIRSEMESPIGAHFIFGSNNQLLMVHGKPDDTLDQLRSKYVYVVGTWKLNSASGNDQIRINYTISRESRIDGENKNQVLAQLRLGSLHRVWIQSNDVQAFLRKSQYVEENSEEQALEQILAKLNAASSGQRIFFAPGGQLIAAKGLEGAPVDNLTEFQIVGTWSLDGRSNENKMRIHYAFQKEPASISEDEDLINRLADSPSTWLSPGGIKGFGSGSVFIPEFSDSQADSSQTLQKLRRNALFSFDATATFGAITDQQLQAPFTPGLHLCADGFAVEVDNNGGAKLSEYRWEYTDKWGPPRIEFKSGSNQMQSGNNNNGTAKFLLILNRVLLGGASPVVHARVSSNSKSIIMENLDERHTLNNLRKVAKANFHTLFLNGTLYIKAPGENLDEFIRIGRYERKNEYIKVVLDSSAATSIETVPDHNAGFFASISGDRFFSHDSKFELWAGAGSSLESVDPVTPQSLTRKTVSSLNQTVDLQKLQKLKNDLEHRGYEVAITNSGGKTSIAAENPNTNQRSVYEVTTTSSTEQLVLSTSASPTIDESLLTLIASAPVDDTGTKTVVLSYDKNNPFSVLMADMMKNSLNQHLHFAKIQGVKVEVVANKDLPAMLEECGSKINSSTSNSQTTPSSAFTIARNPSSRS